MVNVKVYNIFFTLLYLILCSCNPVGEEINNSIWNSLHNSKPFQSDFFHSNYYRFPYGSCNEVQCHGKNLEGGNSGAPSCISCHDDQWTIFTVSHTLNINGCYHKNSVDQYPTDRDSNANWFKEIKYNCAATSCHESDLNGNIGSPSNNFPYRYSCTVCHNGFSKPIPPPGHKVKMSEEGKTGWHHYYYEKNHVTNCSGAACHGNDGVSEGTAIDASSGLIAAHGPSCNICHD
jgi:hypothetical protein